MFHVIYNTLNLKVKPKRERGKKQKFFEIERIPSIIFGGGLKSDYRLFDLRGYMYTRSKRNMVASTANTDHIHP